MDIAIRVWERYRLAHRVAERSKRGDAIGDPQRLLSEFQKLLSQYSEKESLVLHWQKLNEEVQRLHVENDSRAQELREERDRGWGPRGPSLDLSVFLRVYGFPSLQKTAQLLCLSILQQYVLPDKTRKSIEVASKFWVKNPRMNPSGRTVEDTIAKRMDLYIDHLRDFRRHEKVFESAVREGRPHGEGDLTTNLKAGSFLLVNTGGFDQKTMEDKVPIVEEVERQFRKIGLGMVCYGSVNISNRLSGENIIAFYHPPSDEMFIRADAKVSWESDQSFGHELAHRYEHKVISGKKNLVVRLYNTISIHSERNVSYEDFPKTGEPVEYEGKSMVVIDSDYRRRKVRVRDLNDAKVMYTMTLQMYNRLKGHPEKTHPLDFVTAYAKRGGPSENFAEMVSYYAQGRLPKEQVELLLPLLS